MLNQRRSGILLHPTSLPGPHGSGDFGPDAYRFVDWLAATGQRLWQWLPTTPIGPGNSPYQSVSAFAGNPLLVALEPLVEAGWLDAAALPRSAELKVERVDFATVVPARMAALRTAWRGFAARADALARERYAAWSQAQASWLDDYALFMAIETEQSGAAWWHWPHELRKRDPSALEVARARLADEIGFWHFVQWCFDEQLLALKRYANARDVLLVGDLPIFIAHHSADCWTRPDLYWLDADDQPVMVAGVPPDDLGPDGQRWGNPLYLWERMAAEGYAWWIARLHRALDQADIFRVDHFRGFAGYYRIPAASPHARVGEWVPGPGKALFEAIEAALGELPIIAEDLGYITPDVIELRDAFGFPGMRILQFAFGTDGGHEFLPHNYTSTSVVYTGTHDNDTVRGWWHGAAPHERAYAGSYLPAAEHDIHWGMIRAASNSVANLALFPLQDVLGLDGAHRMNVPGTQTGNWEWRFDWPMLDAEAGRVLGLITAASGRAAGVPWRL